MSKKLFMSQSELNTLLRNKNNLFSPNFLDRKKKVQVGNLRTKRKRTTMKYIMCAKLCNQSLLWPARPRQTARPPRALGFLYI